jgi:3D (Asp-Asp-Asp) domain-containing protein
LKLNSIFSGSALICTALLTGSLILSARPLAAETLLSQLQQRAQKQTQSAIEAPVANNPSATETLGAALAKPVGQAIIEKQPVFVVAPAAYIATAYTLRGRTASGQPVSRGLIAADPRILPLGSRVRLEAGTFSGEYLVADTGGAVRGRRIDIWTPSIREALRFGHRTIKLTVLSFGGKRRAAKAARS